MPTSRAVRLRTATKGDVAEGKIINKVVVPGTFENTTASLERINKHSGDARGIDAVDLQSDRSSDDQVASGNRSVIGGGEDNLVNSQESVISGGAQNTIDGGTRSVISGGISNSITGNFVAIGGGQLNEAHELYGVVAGGRANVNNGGTGVISGGEENVVTADRGTIPGGHQAHATRSGELAYANGAFAVVGDAQFSQFVLRIATLDAAITELFLDGIIHRLVLPDNTTLVFDIYIAARRTDVDDESAGYLVQGVIDRNTGVATTALVGAITKTVIAEDTVAWDVDVNADTTNGSLRIQVTGEVGKTIYWVASVKITQVTG